MERDETRPGVTKLLIVAALVVAGVVLYSMRVLEF